MSIDYQPSRYGFTLSEVLSLVKVANRMLNKKDPELQEQIDIINGGTQSKSLGDQAMEALLRDIVTNIVAERLFKNDRQQRLLTASDLQIAAPQLIQIKELADGAIDDDMRRAMEKFAGSFFGPLIDTVCGPTSETHNQYTFWWKYLNTIRDVMAEYPIQAIAFHFDNAKQDQVLRRMYTKKEYSDAKAKSIDETVNIDVAKRLVVDPFFEAISELIQAEDKEKARQEFEEIIMPELQARLDKTREVVLAYYAKEADRIFG